MAVSNKWYRNQSSEVKSAEEELLVFGYSCKIFRDDEKATYIDQGKHLIPWMGDESLMIDRYDVRGYLHDLAPYEANESYVEEQTEEERLCDEERYLALNTDLTEEELYHEEELKRLRAAVASDGAYHEIGFSYDAIEDSSEKYEEVVEKEEEPEDEPYNPPEGLKVPKGMHVPSNMKIHTIIEKTASFVSQQGGQMEIIIKMKQSHNPQFAFMQFDNPLYPYYRHLVQEIKSGRYRPVLEKKVRDSDDEHHDGHYLHPSLSGAAESVPKFTVPTINFRRTGDDSYSLLVKNLKERIEYDAQRNSPTIQTEANAADSASDVDEKEASKPVDSNKQLEEGSQISTSSDSDESVSSDSDDESDKIIPPPPDVQPIIDKMAQYVAKNGVDFETIVKSKNDKRFEFLKPGHKYYNYYISRKKILCENVSSVPAAAENSCQKAVQNSQTSEKASYPVPPPPPPPFQSSLEPLSKIADNSEQKDSTDEDSKNADTVGADEASADSTGDSRNSNKDVCEADTTVSSIKLSASPVSQKAKPVTKVIKGPICFQLKPKDSDASQLEKQKKASLLLDDSEEEEGEKEGGGLAASQAKSGAVATASTDKKFKPVTAQSAVSAKAVAASSESEEKTRKLNAEEMEAKLAEEKIKDKLAAAARERLAQQKRDKQLQLERKQRAAMFLKMLQKKSGEIASEPMESIIHSSDDKPRSGTGTPETKNGSFGSPDLSEKNSPKDGLAPPVMLCSSSPTPAKGAAPETWSSSSSSDSEESVKGKEEEAPVEDYFQQVTSSEELSKQGIKRKKSPDIEDKKHSKHKSHSKSHKHSKKHKRSRSVSSHKHKSSKSRSHKEKKLPAAYSLSRRSRSRSRSPVRYTSRPRSRSPPYFNRWR